MQDRVRVQDDLGDELSLDRLPNRIVSLVPSVTETVIDLGAAKRLVGITNYCVHPAEVVSNISKVGGTKGFSLDKIDDLKPDLIGANKEENRKHQIDKLRESYPVFVTYPRTVDGAIKMVLDLGTLTGTSPRASKFASKCRHLLESMDPATVAKSLRTACMIWRDPWMAAGYDTYMRELLECVGFNTVFDEGEDRYPETTLSTIAQREPDVIMLPNEPYEFGTSDKNEVDAFLEEQGSKARTLLVDGSYLTWFGTRTIKGLRFLYDTKSRLVSDT